MAVPNMPLMAHVRYATALHQRTKDAAFKALDALDYAISCIENEYNQQQARKMYEEVKQLLGINE